MSLRDARLRVASLPEPEAISFLEREWRTVERSWSADVDFERRPLVLGAYDDGALVGVARGYVRAGVGHLSELVTAASHRGRAGVGSALVREWEAQCRAEGCHKVTLSTVRGERAERFLGQGAEGGGRLRTSPRRRSPGERSDHLVRGYVVEATLREDKGRLDWSLMAKWLSR